MESASLIISPLYTLIVPTSWLTVSEKTTSLLIRRQRLQPEYLPSFEIPLIKSDTALPRRPKSRADLPKSDSDRRAKHTFCKMVNGSGAAPRVSL